MRTTRAQACLEATDSLWSRSIFSFVGKCVVRVGLSVEKEWSTLVPNQVSLFTAGLHEGPPCSRVQFRMQTNQGAPLLSWGSSICFKFTIALINPWQQLEMGESWDVPWIMEALAIWIYYACGFSVLWRERLIICCCVLRSWAGLRAIWPIQPN